MKAIQVAQKLGYMSIVLRDVKYYEAYSESKYRFAVKKNE